MDRQKERGAKSNYTEKKNTGTRHLQSFVISREDYTNMGNILEGKVEGKTSKSSTKKKISGQYQKIAWIEPDRVQPWAQPRAEQGEGQLQSTLPREMKHNDDDDDRYFSTPNIYSVHFLGMSFLPASDSSRFTSVSQGSFLCCSRIRQQKIQATCW